VELAPENSRLTIRGQRTDTLTTGGEGRYQLVERGHGSFSRTLEFADAIQTDGVAADLTDGVLTITLPKIPAPPVRKIEVR
jgi:HSP20 family protein